MRCFLAFVSCLRWENVLLSTIHHPNAVITTHFYVVAFRLSYEKWYLFPYSSVFYTVSRFDIYKYVIIHICFGEALFSLMKKKQQKNKKKNKKTATPFHQSMQVCIKQIMVCKPLSAVVCCFKVSFTIKWRKSCQRNSIYNNQPAAILKDFRLENIDCTEYQLIFLTAEEILSKTFLF